MLFTIRAETRGGLRVIPTIPDIDRCWLEGRNGIGKTVAVRLLELVAGKQPFSSDVGGWTALKENLGPSTILITEFPATADIQSIRVDLTPDQWPDHPAPLNAELGSVFIDDVSSDYQTLRDYFDVSRIGGDETVLSQIRALIGADHSLATRCRIWLESAARDAESVLTPLIIDLERLSHAEFESAGEAVRLAREHVNASNSQLQAMSERQQDLEELIQLSDLRNEQEMLGPGVRAALEESTSRVRELTTAKDELTDELRALVPEHAASQQLQRELERLQTLRDGRRARAARTNSTAQQAVQALGLDVGTIASALHRAHDERSALRQERSELAALPEVLELVGTTRAPLDEVEGSSLDAEVVAVVEGTQRITASALRSGLDERIEELKRDVAYDALAEFDQRIHESSTRIRHLRRAMDSVQDAERKATLLSEVEEQIDVITQQLRESTGNEYSRVSRRLREVESNLTDAIRLEAEYKVHLELLNRKGGEEKLRSKITELEQELGIPAHDAAHALHDATSSRQELNAAHQQLRFDLSKKETVHQALEEQLVRALQLVSRGADYQWLRDSIPDGYLPTIGTERRDAIRRLTKLAEAARSVQSKVDDSLNRVATVEGALDGITRSIAMHQEPPRNRYRESLIRWYEGQMAEYLSNRDICEAIFDGGDFQRFDLVNGFVSWYTRAGELRRRPIEAFSSGERAFAYILAAILSHRESTARYRVFVLDEFGAFVEQSRRSRLWHFLDERLLDAGIATQVIVILPSQSSSPGDAQNERFEAEGYFATEARL